MTIIIVDTVSVTYANGVEALRGFSLSMDHGEFVAIVGPSGCGKSTLLRVIAGLLPPTGGTVTLNGEPVTQPSSHISMLFQEPALLPWRTVENNIHLPFEVGIKDTRLLDNLPPSSPPPDHHVLIGQWIDLVGLRGFEHALPRELSGGMAQRAALARALVTQPPVLLLDEPFGALDALTRESLTVSLEGIWRAANTTALMVTHSIREAIFLADRVVICSPRPGVVAGVVYVDLPRPRTWEMESSSEFAGKRKEIRACLGE